MAKPKVVHKETEHDEGESGFGKSAAALVTGGLSVLLGYGSASYRTTLVLDDGSTITGTGDSESDSVADAYKNYNDEHGEDDD